MILIFSTPIALLILIYAICKRISYHADREREFWKGQEIYGNPVWLKLYNLAKILLGGVAFSGINLIFVSLAYGKVPAISDFKNPEFLKTALATAAIMIPQVGIFGIYKLIRRK